MPDLTLFKRLAAIYSRDDIQYPHLKAVTLAQWLIESGRGTSDLARLHYNFGGLKWRPEMRLFATPITYVAHDGVDKYCKFATLENFIDGYWAFIGRAPYSGWESHVSTGEDYIRFIGKVYTPKLGYANDVLALVPEAQSLLFAATEANGIAATAGDIDLGTIILDPGHGGTINMPGSNANNAISVKNTKEKKLTLDFCLILRDELISQAHAAGEKIKVVLTRDTDKNLPGSVRAGMAFTHMAKALICLHFNGSEKPAVRGFETFYRSPANVNLNLDADLAFCREVHSSLGRGLHMVDATTPDRGLKPDTATGPKALGLLNDNLLGNHKRVNKCVAAYIELEFITNPKVETLIVSGPDAIANRKTIMAELAKGVRKQMKVIP